MSLIGLYFIPLRVFKSLVPVITYYWQKFPSFPTCYWVMPDYLLHKSIQKNVAGFLKQKKLNDRSRARHIYKRKNEGQVLWCGSDNKMIELGLYPPSASYCARISTNVFEDFSKIHYKKKFYSAIKVPRCLLFHQLTLFI